ncbi:hypothetical protein NFD60_13195 (plasmid) [Staphylococcus epidermidis]|nr:hypothetical protein NFD60_13195 [Staphylococcus epidermidis]
MLKQKTKNTRQRIGNSVILGVCTLNKLGIAQMKEVDFRKGKKKKLSDDEIVKKTEVKYIDNIKILANC